MMARSWRLLMAVLAVLAAVWRMKRYRHIRAALASPHTIHLKPAAAASEAETAASDKARGGLDFFRSQAVLGSVLGRGGLKIQYAVMEPKTPSLRTVFFLHGWTESMVKYGDFFQELVEQHGVRVVAMDHRSHGASERHVLSSSAAPFKSHVLEFNDHVTDALAVLRHTTCSTSSSSSVFIMGFSLGGLIALELNKLVPSAGLVLVAPCLHVGSLPVVSRSVVRTLAWTVKQLAGGEAFVPGHPFVQGPHIPLPPDSLVTSSTSRARFWNELRASDDQLCVNGMSWSHLHCFCTPDVNSTLSPVITQRVLVLSGSLDVVVDKEAIFEFCHLQQDVAVRHVHIHGCMHDMLCEQDHLRALAVREIFTFVTL